jgi:pimeloyl-ACP methyl ester carboxylesterase
MRYNRNIALIGLLMVAILTSCRKTDDIPRIDLQDLRQATEETFIRDWKIIGPVNLASGRIKKGTLAIDADGLKGWGLKEDSLSTDDFNAIKNEGKNDGKADSSDFNAVYKSDNNVVFYASLKRKGETDLSLSYAMTILNSPVEQDLSIFTGAADFMKLWVNDSLLYRKVDWSPTERSYKALTVHLKKGENKFLVKIWNHNSKWSFYLSLASLKSGKDIYLNKQNGNFLMASLLKPQEQISFELNKPFFANNEKATVKITDVAGKIAYQKIVPFRANRISLSNALEPEKAYAITVTAGSDSISQLIYIGDTTKLITSLKNLKVGSSNHSRDKDNLNAILTRYSYLQEFGNENGKDDYLERKVVYCLYEMSVMHYRAKHKLEISRHVPGLHLRSYISRIDGSRQYYMIYIPKSYNQHQPLPLVTEMPWVADHFRHFLKGWRVADLYRTNMVIRQADKFGYAYLWSCARTYNKPNYTSIANTATMEEIEAIREDYAINMNKLYLIGTCLGGGNAISFASKYPKRIAAVGVTGPALDQLKLQPIENFKYLPLYIAHSQWDGKASFELSRRFADSVKHFGGNISFVDLGYLQSDILVNFYPQDLLLHNIFSFFKNKTRHVDTDTITYAAVHNKYLATNSWLNLLAIGVDRKVSLHAVATGGRIIISGQHIGAFELIPAMLKPSNRGTLTVYLNQRKLFEGRVDADRIVLGDKGYLDVKNKFTEGPIYDGFGDSFYIVRGTAGNKAECLANQQYSNTLAAMWSEDFNASCRLITDAQADVTLLRKNNLVLIGNRRSNMLIRKLSDVWKQKQRNIAAKLHDDASTIAFIMPNPYNNKKYVVMITAEDPQALKSLSFRPWYEGDKDFVIFQNGKIKRSGFFNQHWD